MASVSSPIHPSRIITPGVIKNARNWKARGTRGESQRNGRVKKSFGEKGALSKRCELILTHPLHRAHPYEYAQIQHACGQDCLLQRFRTTDDFIISNGFSIAYYPRGIDFDVHQIERTFVAAPSDKGWNMDFMIGPQRQSLLNTGRKISWDLKESTRLEEKEGGGKGVVRQTYVRKKGDERWSVNGKQMVDVDGVIELVWIP